MRQAALWLKAAQKFDQTSKTPNIENVFVAGAAQIAQWQAATGWDNNGKLLAVNINNQQL